MLLSDFIISYGSRSCSLEDYIEYKDRVSDCPELSKIPVIVYLGRELDKLPTLKEDEIGIDSLMELSHGADPTVFIAYIALTLKLKEIPQDFFYYAIGQNEDEKHNALYNVLMKIL